MSTMAAWHRLPAPWAFGPSTSEGESENEETASHPSRRLRALIGHGGIHRDPRRGQGRQPLAYRAQSAHGRGHGRDHRQVRSDEPRHQDQAGADRLGVSRHEAPGRPRGRRPARRLARPGLCGALTLRQGPAAPRQRDLRIDRHGRPLRCGDEAQLPPRRQLLRHRPRVRHRPHRLPQGLLPRCRTRSGEGARDLGRVARAAQGADRGHRRRRQERPLRPRPRRPRLLHQRRGLHVDRLERRAALRRKPPADLHRTAGARDARLLEGACGLLPRAGLAEPRLPRHLRHACNRQGGQHLRLGPRHRLLRKVRAGGGRRGRHRDLPLQANRPERHRVPDPARLRAVDGVQGREAPAGGHRLPQVLLPAR